MSYYITRQSAARVRQGAGALVQTRHEACLVIYVGTLSFAIDLANLNHNRHNIEQISVRSRGHHQTNHVKRFLASPNLRGIIFAVFFCYCTIFLDQLQPNY